MTCLVLEDMPVQGEVAFDPFAMMDEQPDSKFTTVGTSGGT